MAGKKLGLEPVIDPTAKVSKATLGRYTEIGARTAFVESTLGDYSYVVNDANVIYTTIGKFCSIAAMTRINPGNHPMQRASQSHFSYRSSAYFDDAEDDAAFFDWRRAHAVTIGHDVWIGHGAIASPAAASAPARWLPVAQSSQRTLRPTPSSPAIRPGRSASAFRTISRIGCRNSAGGTGNIRSCAPLSTISATSPSRTSSRGMRQTRRARLCQPCIYKAIPCDAEVDCNHSTPLSCRN